MCEHINQRSLLPHAVSLRLIFWQGNKTLEAIWRHSHVLLLWLLLKYPKPCGVFTEIGLQTIILKMVTMKISEI